MVKSKKNKNNVSSRRTKRPVVVRVPRSGLDASALAYAKLIADPCNAPLAHPTYSGTEGGYLVRCESFGTISTQPGAVAGAISWVPGAIGSEGVELSGFAAGDSTTPNLVAPFQPAVQTPGRDFLRGNASLYRCVAACLKVSFPGAESTRSGRIHYGQASGAFCKNGTSYSVNALAGGLSHYSRTPADEIEIIWKPNDADQLGRDPNLTTALQDYERRAAIVVAFAGLPATVGLTIRMTAIYEWQPMSGEGLSNPNLSKSPSRNSLDEVVNYLISQGFGFVKSAAMSMSGPMGNAILNGVTHAFGNMAAVPRSRRLTGVFG
nr:hypothetical protein [Tolivirales sp.]